MKIKNYILTLVLTFLLIVPSLAQIDRTHAPKPEPAPVVNIGDYQSFQLKNGLKIIVVENHKLPKVTYSLVFNYDNVLEKENTGCGEFTGNLIGTGTKTKKKAEIDETIDFIGATFHASQYNVYASALKQNNEKLLQIFSDILLNPVFSNEELEKLKIQTLSGLTAAKTDPGSIASRLNDILTYGNNHPYGEAITEESIKKITTDLCTNFYQNYFRPNISYLAIVGDISLKEAKPLIEKYFGKWEKAVVPSHNYEVPQLPKTREVDFSERTGSVQSIINVCYPLDFKVGSPDYIKAEVANTVLGGGVYRLFLNLREKHGYTYGAYSSLKADKLAGSFLASTSVRNAVTDSSVNEILYEMNRLTAEKVPDDELIRVKNYMSGNFALSLENPLTVASFAINIDRYHLPKDYYTNYLKNLAEVNSDDVLDMAKKYIKPENCHILVVGESGAVSESLKKFSPDGQIKYFDFNGKQYDPLALKNALPANLTAQNVIDNYIQAIGGRENLLKVKDLSMKMSTTMQGMSMSFTTHHKVPNKFVMEISMNGHVMMKTVCDGQKAKITSMGNTKELNGTDLETMKEEAVIFPELDYNGQNEQISLKSVQKIDGKDCYEVAIKSPSGKNTSDYFDVKTGLKIKSVSVQTVEGVENTETTEYSDYKDQNGILFPFTMKQSMGPQIADIKVDSIEINTNLSDDLFNL